MPKVSVLVSTFRPGGIDILLAGMRDQTFKNFEVIVVDRRYEIRHDLVMAAADGLDLYHVPEHRRNGKWAAIGSAWNTAMALANGDIFIFLPDWTYTPPGWIEAHLAVHAATTGVVYTAAPYRYTALPQVGIKKPFDFSTQQGRGASCSELDAVLRGEIFEELSAFMEPFTGEVAFSLPHHLLPHQDSRVADAGQALHPTWLHVKNESLGRDLAFMLNGLDERLDRGKGPLDIDWGYRLAAVGVMGLWTPAAMALCPNPRLVCGTMPWGDRDTRVESRWSYLDGDAYNQRRKAELNEGGNVQARNPFKLIDLRERLVDEGWRDKTKVVDVTTLEVADLAYFGGEIWPDTP